MIFLLKYNTLIHFFQANQRNIYIFFLLKARICCIMAC